MQRVLLAEFGAVGVALTLAAGVTFCDGGGYRVGETRVGVLDAARHHISYSRDGRHMAYATKTANKWQVMVDDAASPGQELSL
jgi:hypothetical protein